MTQPRVGIIVPCFNQGRFARECVESIAAQTYANWEAVVVDDASTDDSAAILDTLQSERVTVVHLARNAGRALVRNEAVRRLGEVDYVLNVDCDDRLSSRYVEQLVAALEAAPQAGLAYGTLHFFGAIRDGETTWPRETFVAARRYLDNVIPGPGVMFRRAALTQTKGWRREFTATSGEDWDIWLQVVEKGWEPLWVRDARYDYRQHEASFLAGRSERTQCEIELNILRLHASGIRRSSGMPAFLEPHLLPALLSAIRGGEWRTAAHLAAPLVRNAPLATLGGVSRHYLRRLRAILAS